MIDLSYSRRDVLKSAVGLAGLTLPTFFRARAEAGVTPRAKACIVLYCWGGISHLESWDPKPDGPSEIRGEFKAIPTATPGMQFCEHLPLLAKHSEKVAIVRSLTHRDGGHGSALHYALTGKPHGGKPADSRENWPSLAAMISRFREPEAGVPGAVRVPYPMYDNGTLIPGQNGGWLGPKYDPVLLVTPSGVPFGGVSRMSGKELDLKLKLAKERVRQRCKLLESVERRIGVSALYESYDRYQRMAADLLLDSAFSQAYDLETEDIRIRSLYGNHIGGQSLLLARRLVEIGVPVVQVTFGAGDLAGGSGDNWDTHRDHFSKMKKRLLPVFDRSLSALLADLEQRGMLEETLVAVLTEFGRTPKINGNAGRDHHPSVYSVLLAGGGIRGGIVYGASDSQGMHPAENPCTPADLHATIYKALGIDPRAEIHDEQGRPYRLCDGEPLPLF